METKRSEFFSCDIYVIVLIRYVMLHFVTFTVRRVIPRFVATSLLSGPIRTIGLGAEWLSINFLHGPDSWWFNINFRISPKCTYVVLYQPYILFLNGSIPTIVGLARETVYHNMPASATTIQNFNHAQFSPRDVWTAGNESIYTVCSLTISVPPPWWYGTMDEITYWLYS
jgi:hypothetical protein